MQDQGQQRLIAVDWGTTSFRAFRMRGGTVVDRRQMPGGIMAVPPGGFAEALQQAIGSWLAEGETRVLMSGMVGSRQGWQEAPYLPCPAGPADLAASLTAVPFAGATVQIVPGLSGSDADGVPEVMRGEEAQLAGALPEMGPAATACLPGTHSKWVEVRDGRIAGFSTHMTGEAFAALRGHTILSRTIQDGPVDPAAFTRGVARANQSGGLLHHLFGVRTQSLFGRLPEAEAGAYLSGLLIGHEVRQAQPRGVVHLIGAPELCALYAQAIAWHGAEARVVAADSGARGLALIGGLAPRP